MYQNIRNISLTKVFGTLLFCSIFAVAAQAQTATVVNNTSCVMIVKVLRVDNATCQTYEDHIKVHANTTYIDTYTGAANWCVGGIVQMACTGLAEAEVVDYNGSGCGTYAVITDTMVSPTGCCSAGTTFTAELTTAGANCQIEIN